VYMNINAKSLIIGIVALLVTAASAGAMIIGPPPTPTPGPTPGPTPPQFIYLNQYAVSGGSPTRLEVGKDGRIYVSYYGQKEVRVYSNSGIELMSIASKGSPVGVGIDNTSGRIYVGDVSYKEVRLYNSDGSPYQKSGLQVKLGIGTNEFSYPLEIAVYQGRAYVLDKGLRKVRVYASEDGVIYNGTSYNTGQRLFDFGYGTLLQPNGIAMDEAAGEIYILDAAASNVKVFNTDGGYLSARTIEAKSTSASGLAVDSKWLYLADRFQDYIKVIDKTTKTISTFAEYGSAEGQLKTPTDVGLDGDGKVFITNSNNLRLEVYGKEGYTGLQITPEALNFSTYESGSCLSSGAELRVQGQSAQTWQISGGASWLSVTGSDPGTPPATPCNPGAALQQITTGVGATAPIYISVDPAGLSASPEGEPYTAQVVFKRGSEGIAYVLFVTLEVKGNPAWISAAPSSLPAFKHQINGADLPSGTIIITTGGTLTWSATAQYGQGGPTGWLKVSPSSGSESAGVKVETLAQINAMAEGGYDAMIEIAAGGAQGSPAYVSVHLDLLEAGDIEVHRNLGQGSFRITGPEQFDISEDTLSWTAQDVKPGRYHIEFSHISGYYRPQSRDFTVQSGERTEVEGTYIKRRTADIIIAGAGDKRADNIVNVLAIDGKVLWSAAPFKKNQGIRVGAADMDGDGIDEVVMTDGAGHIKVYGADGKQITDYELGNGQWLEISAADIDGDGKAEITAAWTRKNEDDTYTEAIETYGLEAGALKKEATLLREAGDKHEAVTIAVGDIDGDGRADLITGGTADISAYGVDIEGGILSLKWSRAYAGGERPNLASGDINDDGIDEIIVGAGPDRAIEALVSVLNGDGTDYGVDINAYGEYDYRYGATAAAGDIDGDGKAEIAAGAGPGRKNEALIRLYDGQGVLLETIKALDCFLGVNVSLGSFGR
jgi:hypothetical protein